MQNLLFLIPLLPFIGFLINGLFGKRISKGAVSLVGCAMPFLSFGLAMLTLKGVPLSQNVFDWITVGSFSVSFGLKVDELSRIMLLVVTGVGSFIHLYSIGYMKGDKGYARYFSYLNLFMSAMLVLVMADNLVLMFVGWDGVGLCSYLLIGFWFEDLKNADAGKKAFIVNRVGDFGFILGMFLLYTLFGTLNIDGLSEFSDDGWLGNTTLTVATLLLFLGACGKSAQIPLYVWLPDAMAGPTPVSALIHAATMVTAGVYMICRLGGLFIFTPFTMDVIGVVAGATALYTAVIAIAQTDIKKILAYSTISQLGYMFMAVAAGGFDTGIFHLTTHAFFKALLFLSAGAVIHALNGEQDITKMGGLRRQKGMGFIFAVFLIGAIAISGIPPFAGFFSKDEILTKLYTHSQLDGGVVFGPARSVGEMLWLCIWISALITALLTAFYTFRLIFIAFFGQCNLPEDKLHHIHKPDWSMKTALVVLAFLSIIGGIFGGAIHYKGMLPDEGHTLNLILSLVAAFGGLLLAFILYIPKKDWVKQFTTSTAFGRAVHKVVSNKFYVDEIYDIIIVTPLKLLAFVLWLVVDRAIIDNLFVNGSAAASQFMSGRARKLHTGIVNMNAIIMAIGIILILIYLALRVF
ncbi:MAG: NADH-quinone oxidoreductase subunit L [Planctomycetes bacterium RBG_16_43_13]|nr:MAG: NADH-quinone oxidoreductase subunit L [Planctomycetes bacterium RBG_16_43_13]